MVEGAVEGLGGGMRLLNQKRDFGEIAKPKMVEDLAAGVGGPLGRPREIQRAPEGCAFETFA